MPWSLAPGTPPFLRLFKYLEDRMLGWEDLLLLAEVMSCYTARKVVPRRVILRIMPGRPRLVLESSTSDKGWKQLFFFVKKSSLSKEGL